MPPLDISIAGEINMDLILYGLPSVMPEEQELLADGFRMTLGGSSAILAHNLAILGAQVSFVTRTGPDPLGALALERLAAAGVDLSHQVQPPSSTGTGVTVLLPHGASRHILTYPGTMAEMTCDDLDFEHLASARHFHLSSVFLQTGLHDGLPQLLRRLKDRGLTLSLDTNDDPSGAWGGVLDSLLDLVDIVLPNEREACLMTRQSTLDAALQVLSARVPMVAVKRGPLGAMVVRGSERVVAEPVAVDPVDTIGAGDSFDAGFLYAWLHGADAATCARAGNITGALSTLRPGGTEAFRDASLWRPFLRQHGFPEFA